MCHSPGIRSCPPTARRSHTATSATRPRRQEQGTSVKRQNDQSAAWSARSGVPLDSRSYHAYGKSAYTGAHLDNADLDGLSAFLAEATRTDGLGRVRRDDYLVIENLDRLSREHVRKAHTLFNSILDAGVNIVTTSPEYVYRHDSDQIVDTMLAVMEFVRSNRESEQKSVRLKASWADRREKRLVSGRTLTGRVPAWVTVTVEGERKLNDDVATTIRRLFDLALDGHGVYSIAGKMNAEGVVSPTGKPWSESTVYHYLTARTAVGELAPKLGRKKKGVTHRPAAAPPVPDYYPQLVTPEVFARVQRLIAGRAKVDKDGRKRPSGGHRGRAAATNLFAGRVFVFGGDHTYVVRPGGKGRKRLDPLGLKTAVSISYHHFEAVVLRHLRELTRADVLPADGSRAVAEVDKVRDKLDEVKAKIVEFTEAARLKPKSAVVSVLLALEDEKEKLEVRHAAAVQAADSFRPEVLSECQSLVSVLETEGPEVRPKVRTAIARLVDRIDLQATRLGHGHVRFTARIRLSTGIYRAVVGEYNGRRLILDGSTEAETGTGTVRIVVGGRPKKKVTAPPAITLVVDGVIDRDAVAAFRKRIMVAQKRANMAGDHYANQYFYAYSELDTAVQYDMPHLIERAVVEFSRLQTLTDNKY